MEPLSLITLMQNICLLLAAVLFFDVLAGRRRTGRATLDRAVSGIGLGLIGMLIMATSWAPAPGVTIDTRTVLLGLCGLFFGLVPTAIAMAMTAAYRLFAGGAGAWTGVWLILMAGCTGLLWRRLRVRILTTISWTELLLFGMVLHAGLLLLMLTLPGSVGYEVLRHASIPVLLLFPACTALMGKFLSGRRRRREMERSLREREEMFRKTFSDHQAVMLLIEPETGAILDANRSAERFYGWNKEELINKTIYEINVLPKEEVLALVARARTGEQTHFAFEHRLADGATRFVDVYSSKITVRGRDIIHSIIHDVTGEKRAQEALRESEDRLHLAVEGAGLGLWDWNIPEGGLAFNEKWAELIGYAAAELAPADIAVWKRRIAAEDIPEMNLRLNEHFKGGTEHCEHVLRMHHRNGNVVWMRVRGKVVQRDGRGDPVRMLGTMEDVSERQRQQAVIEREVQRRKILMDNSNDGILIINDDHRIVETNRRFAEMLGYAEEELLGMQTWEYAADYDEPSIREAFADLRTINMVIEGKHRRKDGVLLDVEVSLSGSEVMGEGLVMAIVRDISDRKQAQAALRTEMERAEAANQAKSEFLANMSHEIRTPLGGILGMLQLLQSTTLDVEQAEYVDTAIRSSRRLNRLLTDVLDLSRVEAGKLSLHRAPFDLEDDVRQVCEMFQLASPQSGVDLRCRVDPAIPRRLAGDSPRLQQVLINLVGNALKFTSSGFIEITAEELPPRLPGTARVLFSVADTGLGIDADKLGSLFSPFTQAHEGYTRQFQGAGLGLSICRRLVELMEGDIAIDSAPGEGTTVFFALHFGLPAEEAETVEAAASQAPPTSGPLSILLAEDDRVNHIATKRLLEKQGHRVTGVENGEEVLSALTGGDFDIVLMDIQMPVLNGMETTRAIRAGRAGARHRDIPIIALTAYAMAEDRERILGSGMNGYLTKPMGLEDLRKTLARVGR
ncbi:MAG: PAS domain S-box protein [Pseudodesulfovibrio sp.]